MAAPATVYAARLSPRAGRRARRDHGRPRRALRRSMAGERPPEDPGRIPTGARAHCARSDVPDGSLSRARASPPGRARALRRGDQPLGPHAPRRRRAPAPRPHDVPRPAQGERGHVHAPLPPPVPASPACSSATLPTTRGSARSSTRRSPRARSSAWRRASARSSTSCSTPSPGRRASILSRRSPGRCR